ncbi:MAG: MarR family transcriptional regulator [Bradyrhizobiaceae bacterium]|nr:MarR family transcriptional regulator [Bradyrhizobiaceae bacterium]
MSKSTAKPDAFPGVEDLLCFAVYSAGHAFNRVYKPLLDELGLTYPQYLVMVALWTRDDQTVGELGEKLFLESSTLTPLLKRLEATGNLSRSRDPSDERQVRVRLTKTGDALRAKAREVPNCILEATGLSPAAMRELLADVSAIRARLMKASK